MKQHISATLKELGISPAHLGYSYLRYAIELALEGETIIHRVTKELYPVVAKRFKTTPTRVERAMRHAIEMAWSYSSAGNDTITTIFSNTVSPLKGKPTNSEFVATVADYLRVTPGSCNEV